MDANRLHLRLLQVVDELHRVGFEQLRFARNMSGQAVRIQVYAARSNPLAQDWIFEGQGPMLCFSYASPWANYPTSAIDAWALQLSSDVKPKHLAGLFVLDFPEIARLAYGADHEYREWFRTLRPLLQQGYLPLTWEEDPYGTEPNFDRHVVMQRGDGQTQLLPRPPMNPWHPATPSDNS